MPTKLWNGNLKGRDHTEDLGINREDEKQSGKLWSGFIWLRIRTSSGLL
jgi:hypothetical protein